MVKVAADQRIDGSVPNTLYRMFLNSPSVPHAAGWGDVAIITPWTMYLLMEVRVINL
jgi:hypothetical protein